jgi:hypothetical protein
MNWILVFSRGLSPHYQIIIQRTISLFLLTALLITLMGCDTKNWEDAGYGDGYAATVNTVCGFRSTLVHGKYDNADYAKGYARGANAGAADVKRRGCNALK